MLNLQPEVNRHLFDTEPFGFTHEMSGLPLFSMQRLRQLAFEYCDFPADYYVAVSAASAEQKFYSGTPLTLKPHEALDRLDTIPLRILLKRVDRHDREFNELLRALFDEVVRFRGGLNGERVVRLESGLFISSASSITPCHFDPEINFFAQIAGEKTYHLFPPSAVSEDEMERFYVAGAVNIAQVDLAKRDPSKEHIFVLNAGKGLHQPQNSPHWVHTGTDLSISYSFVFETDASRATGRVRAYNRYLRRLGVQPTAVGASPALDTLKQNTMKIVTPLRIGARETLRKAFPWGAR